jgi:hypothetical protein
MKIPDEDALAPQLAKRIHEDEAFFGGELPRDSAIAWAGYSAALIEWGLLGVRTHRQLMELLPPTVPADPLRGIFLGRKSPRPNENG